MELSIINKIIKEELNRLDELRMTKEFKKATEQYQELMVKQQQMQKKFVAEKNKGKREVLKKKLIALHHKVKKAENNFNAALRGEPVDIEDVIEGYVNSRTNILQNELKESENWKQNVKDAAKVSNKMVKPLIKNPFLRAGSGVLGLMLSPTSMGTGLETKHLYNNPDPNYNPNNPDKPNYTGPGSTYIDPDFNTMRVRAPDKAMSPNPDYKPNQTSNSNLTWNMNT